MIFAYLKLQRPRVRDGSHQHPAIYGLSHPMVVFPLVDVKNHRDGFVEVTLPPDHDRNHRVVDDSVVRDGFIVA